MKERLLKLLMQLTILWRKTNQIGARNRPLVAIGDSWFNLTYLNPVAIDILDYLRGHFNIIDAAFPGYTLRKELSMEIWKFAALRRPDQTFLISLSGNDYMFLEFGKLYDPVSKEPDINGIIETVQKVTLQMQTLFARILERYPESHIVTHGYDFAFIHWSSKFWKGSMHNHRGLTDDQISKIASLLMLEHNATCTRIFADHPQVHFINLLNTLDKPEDYLEDLHPSWAGARKLALKMKWAIQDNVPRELWT